MYPGVTFHMSSLQQPLQLDSMNLVMHLLPQGFLYSEGVHIEYVAVFLACLIPGALVALNDDSLQLLSPLRTLRIYCAGIWHNGLCCAGCYLLLMLLPFILSPLYLHRKTPMVLSIPSKSPLAGHLSPGDSILEVAGLKLESPQDWHQRLHVPYIQGQSHMSDSKETSKPTNETQWDSPNNIMTNGLCVHTQNLTAYQREFSGSRCSSNELLFELPCTSTTSNDSNGKRDSNVARASFCLKATDIMKYPACGRAPRPTIISDPCGCSEDGMCLLPMLDHGEVLIDIKFWDSREEGCLFQVSGAINSSKGHCQKSLIFVGDPQLLVYDLHLTEYWPRYSWSFSLFSVSFWQWLPDMLERLLMYTFCISSAMALFNSAPVFYLDGEAILQTWLSLSRPYIHPRKCRKVLRIALTVGTFFLVLFLVMGLLSIAL